MARGRGSGRDTGRDLNHRLLGYKSSALNIWPKEYPLGQGARSIGGHQLLNIGTQLKFDSKKLFMRF